MSSKSYISRLSTVYFSRHMKQKLLVLAIVVTGFLIRISLINWDQGHHLHPDERMLIMVADRIRFFSHLNPDFFNYGSLPIYILKGTATAIEAISPLKVANYDGMLFAGRILSTLADTITIVIMYKIGMLVSKNKRIGLWAAFSYMIAFFPIQNSHFFIVDTFLTVFITLQLYLLILYNKNPRARTIGLLAIVSAAAVTTKVSAVIFMPVVAVGLLLPHFDLKSRVYDLQSIFVHALLCAMCYVLCAFLFMPYAFIEHARFISDVKLQTTMNNDPFIFPYTLQYVGTLPYLYYLKNIVLWGWGPVLSIISLIGLIRLMGQPHKTTLLILAFYAIYFVVLGKSAVKFMRYMLPLYPFFALLAGYGLCHIMNEKTRTICVVTIGITIAWTGMFLGLYANEHTRIEASKWIYDNIPAGRSLAVAHWDDRVPLDIPGINGSNIYQFIEFPLYEKDTPEKWTLMEQKLAETDYIIIASNRLYTPLTKLVTCERLPEDKCFPLTAQYYDDLFNERGGFTKVAEFSSPPRIGPFTIDDQSADESFTVYDHPKILIYKRRLHSG